MKYFISGYNRLPDGYELDLSEHFEYRSDFDKRVSEHVSSDGFSVLRRTSLGDGCEVCILIRRDA